MVANICSIAYLNIISYFYIIDLMLACARINVADRDIVVSKLSLLTLAGPGR